MQCFRSTIVSHFGFAVINLDGLYVLLRPAKKSKKTIKQGVEVAMPQPPPHLKHLLVEDDLPENCPWSVSGPQFPIPTAMQQRYCYPKGRSEYSSLKGGALWTMFGANGKEDLQYRLLHVYYSAKRANNRGMPGGAPPIESLQLPLSAPGSPSSQQRRRQRRVLPFARAYRKCFVVIVPFYAHVRHTYRHVPSRITSKRIETECQCY